MQVKIERHTMWFGGKPQPRGAIVETTREKADAILDADRKLGRPARISVIADTQAPKRRRKAAE